VRSAALHPPCITKQEPSFYNNFRRVGVYPRRRVILKNNVIMAQVEINKNIHLSEHFTLGEMCITSAKTQDGNVPSHVHIENLKRLCGWLEMLRSEWNKRYGEGDDTIIINSGYRSEAVNKAVGGAANSNHLTGCAVDIHVYGIEQLVRYATILLDISDLNNEDFDELLLERSPRGSYWLHFAVRPSGNRRKVKLIQT